MRNIKCLKSAALAPLLTVLMANFFISGNSAPLDQKGPGKHLGSDLNASKLIFRNSSSRVGKGSEKRINSDFNSTVGHEDVCLTPGCLHAASAVLKNMDPDVDPCDNFYRHACGGFLKSTVIPDDKVSVDTFNFLEDKLMDQLRRIIEAESSHDLPKPFRLVKNLYKSCMNTTNIEAKGLEPLHVMLKRLGGWPVVDGNSWQGNNFNWRSLIYKFREVGYKFNSLFTFDIGLDLRNNTKRVIELRPPALRLDRGYLLRGFNDKRVSAYYSFMVDIAVMLGAQRDRAMEELKDSLLFEMKLAYASRDVQFYHPMTLQDLEENYSSIPWKELFSRIYQSSVKIGEKEIINVVMSTYITAFEKLITQTPKRVQANYLMWNAVANSIPYLNNKVRERELAYITAFNGLERHPSRSKTCYDAVCSDVGVGIAAMYVRNFFHKDEKKDAVDMVMEIREQFTRMLKEADWLDDKTRNKALEKAAAMNSYVGYPDELLQDDELEKLYKNYELSEDTYFDNSLNASLYSTELLFSQFREPYNKTYWVHYAKAATVNAFYSRSRNSFRFPAGILQGAFFSHDRPKYMNYGAIGSIIGHEITHGFDDKGSQFDKNGQAFDWWDPPTKQQYFKRKACIVNQYSNYTVEEVGLKINGHNTQSENIADNGGIKAAYHAYKNWAARNEPEQLLPGINRTPQQMFWISFANGLCSKDRREALENKVARGSYAPSEFRVLGSISNMPEFAKDFNCPVGSKMNPKYKCSVW